MLAGTGDQINDTSSICDDILMIPVGAWRPCSGHFAPVTSWWRQDLRLRRPTPPSGRSAVDGCASSERERMPEGQPVLADPASAAASVVHTIRYRRLAIQRGLAHLGSINYYGIRHQSLVLETERALRALCCFIQVGSNDRGLRCHITRMPTRDHGKILRNIEATELLLPLSGDDKEDADGRRTRRN
jgi:hypothetical protein